MLNEVVKKVSALTLAASMMPCYGFTASSWNPSDSGSRRWEHRERRQGTSGTRRARKAVRKEPAPKEKARRNRKFPVPFDSTRGYPGEGPAPIKKQATKRVGGRRLPTKRQRAPRQRNFERFPARRTQLERQIARTGYCLRKALLTSTTRRLYRQAFRSLWRWVGRSPPVEVASVPAYDALLAEYINRAWKAGLTRGEAGNALSASVAAFPELRGRGKLPESWYLLTCWSRLEVPCRAPPLPALVALGLAHYFASRYEYGAMFLVLAGFDGFLRTRELLSLTWADVTVDGFGGGVISLAHTKTGQRNAAFEASVILNPIVALLFSRAKAGAAPGTASDFYIFPGSEARFYKLFEEGLQALGLQEFGFRPYSLRRGGATAFYRATRNMSATLERGRWSTARVGRIYINDGLAKEVELRLPPAALALLQRRARALFDALQ